MFFICAEINPVVRPCFQWHFKTSNVKSGRQGRGKQRAHQPHSGASLSVFSWLLQLPGIHADCVCFSHHFPGWFFDWTQSYDLAFYFSGSCVVLGAFILFLLTLPCWNRKPSEICRPDVHYTSNCDKVASVAWIWAPFLWTQISPLLPSSFSLINCTWTSGRNFLFWVYRGFRPNPCCQVLIYQNSCRGFEIQAFPLSFACISQVPTIYCRSF